MRVTIGQINTTNGDIDGNIAKIIDAIEKARADGSDLIVFPEVCTHGYTSQDWFQDGDIIESALEPLQPDNTGDERDNGGYRHHPPERREGRAAAF